MPKHPYTRDHSRADDGPRYEDFDDDIPSGKIKSALPLQATSLPDPTRALSFAELPEKDDENLHARTSQYSLSEGDLVKLDGKLFDATAGDDVRSIRRLVSQGARVNAPGAEGYRVLHRAVEDRKLLSVVTLLECGADPELADDEGRTAFDRVFKHCDLSILKVLLACRSPEIQADRHQLEPLIKQANARLNQIYEHGPQRKLHYAMEVADYLEMVYFGNEPYPTTESLKEQGIPFSTKHRTQSLANARLLPQPKVSHVEIAPDLLADTSKYLS